jgi:hypothetical protein
MKLRLILTVCWTLARLPGGRNQKPNAKQTLPYKNTKIQKYQRKLTIGNSENVFFVVGMFTINCSVRLKKNQKWGTKKNNVKPENQENHVIDIDEMSDEFNYLDEQPES